MCLVSSQRVDADSSGRVERGSMSKTFLKAYYAIDDPLEDLDGPPRSLGWWRRLRAATPQPTRKDVTFTSLKGWHSRLTLCEVLADRSDMVTRIVGEEVKDLYRGHYETARSVRLERGTPLGTVINVSPERQAEHVRRIVDTPAIALTEGRLDLLNGRTVEVYALDFPLKALPDENPFVLTLYEFQTPQPLSTLPHRGLQNFPNGRD